MKQYIYKIFSLVIIFSLICAFTSCETEEGVEYSETCTEAVCMDVCIYNEYIFSYDSSSRTVVYQLANAVQETNIPIYNDSLAEDEDDPFNMTDTYIYLVDEASSDKNNGSPILIMSFQYHELTEDSINSYYKIISYDVLSNKITTIKDKISESIQSLHLYKDYVVYTTNEGDQGYNIHCIKTSGDDYVTLENSDCNLYRVQTVYNDHVYFADAAYQLYSAPIDLSEQEYLFDIGSWYVSAFVEDGYLVYLDNITKTGDAFPSADLCRRNLSDLTSEPETLISNIYIGMNYGDKFYYYEPTSRDGTNNLNTDTLYVYSFDTMTSEVVWTKEGVGYYAAFSDKYIVYENAYPDLTNYIIYNIATGEETEIPY